MASFCLLLSSLPLTAMATGSHGVALLDVFYMAGALVFGGGHVVLPLLEEGVVQPGWIGPDGFLAGYGAAQAVPVRFSRSPHFWEPPWSSRRTA